MKEKLIFLLAFPHEIWHYLAAKACGANPRMKTNDVEVDHALSTLQVIFIAALPAIVDMLGMALWLLFFPRFNQFTLALFWAGVLYWTSGIIGAYHDYRLIFEICFGGNHER